MYVNVKNDTLKKFLNNEIYRFIMMVFLAVLLSPTKGSDVE